MKIKLNEIPENGEEYQFSRENAELNAILNDLVGNNTYQIDLTIRPLNSRDYDLTGQLATQIPEQCSRCGDHFQLQVNQRLHEILIPAVPTDRKDKSSRSTAITTSEDDQFEVSVSEYSNSQFNVGEYLHEAVALQIPFAPICQACEPKKDELFIYDEKMGEEEKPNPFQALKGLKLN